MSFLNGFIANEIDEHGNSYIVRIVWTRRKELLYSIDSETVEDLHVFQNRKKLKPKIEVIGGKTLVKFSAKPGQWIGMVYRRTGFTRCESGVWSYSDFWYIPSETNFILLLPAYAVLERLNVSGFEKFDLDDHLVLSQFFSGGDLQINLEYVIDSQRFASTQLPILGQSTFPYAGSTSMLEWYRSDSSLVRKTLLGLSSTINWIAKGAAIIKAAQILGFL